MSICAIFVDKNFRARVPSSTDAINVDTGKQQGAVRIARGTSFASWSRCGIPTAMGGSCPRFISLTVLRPTNLQGRRENGRVSVERLSPRWCDAHRTRTGKANKGAHCYTGRSGTRCARRQDQQTYTWGCPKASHVGDRVVALSARLPWRPSKPGSLHDALPHARQNRCGPGCAQALCQRVQLLPNARESTSKCRT